MTILEKLGTKQPANDPPKPPRKANSNGSNGSNVFERARKYVAKMQPAISGSGGHNSTWSVALVLSKGFGLTENETFDILWSDYNPRCQPPWDEQDLRHKAASAAQASAPDGFIINNDEPPEKRCTRVIAAYPEWKGAPDNVKDEHRQKQAKPCFAFIPLGDLNVAPDPIPWFMFTYCGGRTHYIWPRGENFALVAHGGAGKGYASLELAICTGLSLKWFGVFGIEHPGHVAVLTGEDSFAEVKRRIWKICNQLGLSPEQRNRVSEFVHVLPLLGLSASLVEQDSLTREIRKTEFYNQLSQYLVTEAPADGWALVIIDPLSRLAGEAETANHLATQFVAAIEGLVTDLPGKPSMLLCHHANMSSVRQGKAKSRGVSGLHDGWRGEFTLRALKTESGLDGVLFSCSKNNHGYRFNPVWLVREVDQLDANGRVISEQVGVLRKATEPEADELKAELGTGKAATPKERKDARQSANKTEFEQDCDLVASLIPKHPQSITGKDLLSQLRAAGKRWDHHKLELRTSYLTSERGGCRIMDLSDGSRGTPRKWTQLHGEPIEPESDPQERLPL